MGFHDEGLVAVVGTAGIHVVAHHVKDEVEVIVLSKGIVVPLQRVVSGHQALEKAFRSGKVLIKRLGTVVPGIDEILGAGRHQNSDGAKCYNYLFHIQSLLEGEVKAEGDGAVLGIDTAVYAHFLEAAGDFRIATVIPGSGRPTEP